MMDCSICQAPGMCICPPRRIIANRDNPALTPFGGVAFAELLFGNEPRLRFRPAPPPVNKHNPKRHAQKAQRIARKKTRRGA
ncbi:MAG: hypothetical protein WCP77_09945 [Roseococcus sp.]